MIKKAVIVSSLFAFSVLTAGIAFAQTSTPTATPTAATVTPTAAPTTGVTTTPSPKVPGEAPSTGRGN